MIGNLRGLSCSVVFASVLVASAASAQSLPTGPYENEQAYQSARNAALVQISPSDSIGLLRAVELEVSDQVDDGCWTNSKNVRARVRAELERSGIAVYDEPLAFRTVLGQRLLVTVVGYRAGGGSGLCVGSAELTLRYLSRDEMGSLAVTGTIFGVWGVVSSWRSLSVLTSGADLNDQLLEWTQTKLDELVADVLQARRKPSVAQFIASWHNELPMTESEFDRLLNSEAHD